MIKRILKIVSAALTCSTFACIGIQSNAATITNSTGISVTLDGSGNYTVQSSSPAWTFGGSLGATPSSVSTVSNTDNIGSYSEITFNYVSGVSRAAAIRLYSNTPAILFSHTYLSASTNNLAFPKLTTYPAGLNFVNYDDGAPFVPFDFGTLNGDSPWIFFDTNYNSFIISPATNYMIANDSSSGGTISCGINSGITNLPANFTHRVILVITNGINQAFDTWGNALTSLGGKTRPANDAAVELNKFGYWTDNFATYYYNMVSNNYPATLMAVRDEFASKGLPLGYMQLDSWWYPKGVADTWQGDTNNNRGGINQFTASPQLFTNGLASFQQQLGLPLIVHSRWIDPASPYNSQYVLSTNTSTALTGGGGRVAVDWSYWTNRMAYLQNGGVITFEHDWLNQNALPAMNLNDPPAFMNYMARSASSNAINMQYCMPLPRHILQGSLYNNLMSSRLSGDGFDTTNWKQFIYGSRFAYSIGIWPWTDVYMSSQTRYLLIGTLSAGLVGTGDALGTVNVANLFQSVRPDAVIVKPDVPLMPLDFNYLNEAQGKNLPLVSSTYTDHNGLRTSYVFAYAQTSSLASASFTLPQLNISSNAYVYDYFSQTGMVVNAGGTFNFLTTTSNPTTGGSYFIVSPIGSSGIGFIGDANKFVTAGKKRISVLTENTNLTVTIAFATGESNVTLTGYSLFEPQVTINNGSASLTNSYSNNRFAITLSPDNSGTASITLNVVSNNLPQITTPVISPSGAVMSGTMVTLTENLSPPWNDAPFTYQWQSNSVNIGSPTTTASTNNSILINTAGFATGSYNYSVVVSNVDGAVVSFPVALTVIGLQLRMPFTDAGGTTTASDTSSSGINITMNMTTNGTVAGNLHGAVGSGVTNLNVNARALDLTTNMGNFQGGGNGGLGNVVNLAASPALATLGNNGIIGNFTISFWMKQKLARDSTGHAPRLWLLNGGNNFQADGAANSMGIWIQATNQLDFFYGNTSPLFTGSNVVTFPTNQWLFFAVTYDGTTFKMYYGTATNSVTQIGSFASSGQTINLGTAACLSIGNRSTDFIRNFNGWMEDFRFYNNTSDSNVVDGVRQEFALPPVLSPSSPSITGISLNGTSLSISATNGTAGGSWTLLQSTNLALPLSQWQTNCTGAFDGNGNLSTNIVNAATNLQEFYILEQ